MRRGGGAAAGRAMARSSLAAAAVLGAWVGGGEDGAGREGGGDEDEAGGLHWARLTTFFTVLRGKGRAHYDNFAGRAEKSGPRRIGRSGLFLLVKKVRNIDCLGLE